MKHFIVFHPVASIYVEVFMLGVNILKGRLSGRPISSIYFSDKPAVSSKPQQIYLASRCPGVWGVAPACVFLSCSLTFIFNSSRNLFFLFTSLQLPRRAFCLKLSHRLLHFIGMESETAPNPLQPASTGNTSAFQPFRITSAASSV